MRYTALTPHGLWSDGREMNSPFAWPGGKRALKTTLLSLIPVHRIYVEVFAGSAKLLFAKDPSPMEIINDTNGDVANFFRVAKHRSSELAERLEIECIHAERFRELAMAAKRPPQSPAECEMERALRFAYLVWYSYGAKGEHFASGSKDTRVTKRPLDRVRELLRATADRLSRVIIEQKDFAWIITRYDSEHTFFYLDPPYVRFSPNARYEALSSERRDQMFDSLATCKAKFLMSFDDCAEIRNAAKARAMQVREVRVKYTLAGTNRSQQPRRELLIANYPIATRS